MADGGIQAAAARFPDGIKRLVEFKDKWRLTPDHVVTAFKYIQAPAEYRMPPSFHAFLRDVLIDALPIEEIERRRGMAPRSGKELLRAYLTGMMEPDGYRIVADPETEPLRAQLAYVSGDDHLERARIMREMGLTQREAQLVLILQRSPGGQASRDAIRARLDGPGPDNTTTDNTPNVMICKMRPRLAAVGWGIETIWGGGYKLTRVASDPMAAQTLDWHVDHHVHEMSIKAIARREGCAPSTVSRRFHRLYDSWDTDQEADAYHARALEHAAARDAALKQRLSRSNQEPPHPAQ